MAAAAYNDPEHRAAVAALRRYPTACPCGAPATTIGHHPPLALHVHRRGSGCCHSVPECVRCNLGAGAAIAARKHRPRRPHASRSW